MAGLIPGVANHEARQLLDARVQALREALSAGDERTLGTGLCEASRLAIWRGRSIQGFDAFAEHVVGLAPARARELARAAAQEAAVSLEQLPDTVVALWLRSEAALLERCPSGRLNATVEGESLTLSLTLPLAPPIRTCEALAAIGRKAQGLGRALEDEQARREQAKTGEQVHHDEGESGPRGRAPQSGEPDSQHDAPRPRRPPPKRNR